MKPRGQVAGPDGAGGPRPRAGRARPRSTSACPRWTILSLHLPGSPGGAPLLDRAALLSMRPGAVLVNTARGDLVDEAALAELLVPGQLRGPGGPLGIAVSMFGLTGVGADEMATYTYWCLEKGYARWTGPDDGTEERVRRAEGWLAVMRLDVFASWLVCTLSFYVIGAGVLHPQNLVPEGSGMISTLSRICTGAMGTWAQHLFLVGALAVLCSTAIGSTASVPRLWADSLGLLGVIDWDDTRSRQRTTEVDARFRANPWSTAALVVSSAAVTALGVHGVLEACGISLG
ncbi:NAD(P)-dependent oxidoreductase [Salinifilum ghardaiensis]